MGQNTRLPDTMEPLNKAVWSSTMCRPSLSRIEPYKTWWTLSKNPGRSFSFTALARSREVTAATRACGPLTQSRTSAKSLRHMANSASLISPLQGTQDVAGSDVTSSNKPQLSTSGGQLLWQRCTAANKRMSSRRDRAARAGAAGGARAGQPGGGGDPPRAGVSGV